MRLTTSYLLAGLVLPACGPLQLDTVCPYLDGDEDLDVPVHDLDGCLEVEVDDFTRHADGTFDFRENGEAVGPWSLEIDATMAGGAPAFSGCVRGAYCECWQLYLVFYIDQIVEDEVVELEAEGVATGRFMGYAHDLIDNERYDMVGPGIATGTATIERYVPAEGEFIGSVSVQTIDDESFPNLAAGQLDIDFDVTWERPE